MAEKLTIINYFRSPPNIIILMEGLPAKPSNNPAAAQDSRS